MRRGSKPAKAKAEAKLPVARKSRTNEGSCVGDLEKRLAEALKREAEALEQQTATAEILRVIASSPTGVQPVFDVIVASAVRLCEARYGAVFSFDGEIVRHVAHHNFPEAWLDDMRTEYPMRPTRTRISGRAILSGSVVQIADVALDPDYGSPQAARIGFRSLLAVPIVRGGAPIGAIVIYRPEAGPFPDNQVALLKTFAAQAVIAIENVRLFNETKEALEQQTATADILRVIASSPTDLQPVFAAILDKAMALAGAQLGTLWRYEGDLFRAVEVRGARPETRALLQEPQRFGRPFFRVSGPWKLVQILDVRETEAYRRREPLWAYYIEQEGMRTLLGVPLVSEARFLGTIALWRREVRAFTENEIALLKTFANQAVIAIENVRLFHEVEDKSRLLEAASRHKSEFLANMSHELRTPLNAILGFSEVLAERMFGEVNAKQAEYLQDILSSGRHLLSLINDILDLSKVEAGRLELELGRFHLPTALDNALTLIRERATRHGITLTQTVDERVGEIVADERKVKQILLNLLSNAVKFTPEGGRVGVTATAAEDVLTIAVSDTGIGIAPEDQAAIFEEFRQVGREGARTQEGTGLGLTLAKKFVELHGGRIGVQSQVGQGSTFTVTLPVQPEGWNPGDRGGGVSPGDA